MARKEATIVTTGRRKCSIARLQMIPGTGEFIVNERALNVFFGREVLPTVAQQPLTLTKTNQQFDIRVNVIGGGISGQAQAIRHAVARALVCYDAELRKVLKKAGFLTRDARAVERKKYGQPKARKRFQYSKR